MTVYGSLCSGIGGLDLGCQQLGWRPAFYVENNPYRQAVLLAHMRDGRLDCAPVWPDLRTFSGLEWRGSVDCLVAGFPCQPYSSAGLRQGSVDKRDLWPEVRRAISEVRPGYVFLENVYGLALRNGGQPAYAWTIIAELTSLGYDTRWGIVSASDAGAPHRRDRWFCMAYANSARGPEPEGQHPEVGRVEYCDAHGGKSIVGNPNRQGLPHRGTKPAGQWDAWPPGPMDTVGWERRLREHPDHAPAIGGKLNPTFVELLMGFPLGWTDIPGATRRYRLRALGDAVVPAQAVLAWELLNVVPQI